MDIVNLYLKKLDELFKYLETINNCYNDELTKSVLHEYLCLVIAEQLKQQKKRRYFRFIYVGL